MIGEKFKYLDDNPAVGVGLCLGFFAWCLICHIKQRASSGKGGWLYQRAGRHIKDALDHVLLWWSQYDSFTIRDLLNGGLLILGMAGSGKTSSSGRTVMQAFVSNRKSGGLILAAKPEDEADIKQIFKRAKREKDLIVFGPNTRYRFNFLRYVGKGDARNVVRCMMMIGETLERGERRGGEEGGFWTAQTERQLETTVICLQSAGEEVTAVNMHRFIMTSATTQQDLNNPDWQQQYHAKVLDKGNLANKSPAREHDYEIAKDYWMLEYPSMASKTRSSILTYTTQILYVFNAGLAKEMIAGDTNVTPDDILKGKWVLVNMPPSSFGAVGSLVSTGWKYLTELAILKRKADENTPFVTIWCDEAHQFVNSYDAHFIAQCRSHKGSLVFLTQSISSFYGAMRGEAGHHQADALLANFSHAIIHACDPTTAKWATAKLGRRIETMWSGSSSQGGDMTIWDRLYGDNRVTGSFGEHYEQVLQDQELMIAKTGGPENGYVADGVVVKSGMPFSTGENWLRVEFSQKVSPFKVSHRRLLPRSASSLAVDT